MKLMKNLRGLFAICILLSATAFAGIGECVKAWMATEGVPVEAGKPFTATIVLDLEPGSAHLLAVSGDTGLPPKVTWHLPEGWTAGPIAFSVPHQFSEPGDMIVYGYEKQQLLRATITPLKDLPKNQVYDLKASLTWLACKELCVPGSAEVSLRILGPTEGPTSIDWQTAIVPKGDWPLAGKPPFPVSVSGKNGTKLLSFTGEPSISYELYPDPADGTTAGHVTQIASGNAIVFSIPWDGAAPFKGLLVEKASRKAWWIGEGASGSVTAQAANTPSSGIALGVLIAALFSGFLVADPEPDALRSACDSLKIFSFIAQAGESPARIFRHGLAFAAGIFPASSVSGFSLSR